jgi:PAS domain S-box-containing protein
MAMHIFKEIKILLVEDDEDDFVLFLDYLNEIKIGRYSLTHVTSFNEGVKWIRQKKHDIYFFDFLLGSHDGLDLIKECVINGIEAPFILLTGIGNHDTDLMAMELGASDYLKKSDLNADLLERCMRYSILQTKTLNNAKDNERKFRTIFENSYDVIYISDNQGTIHEINKAGERLLGYSRDEFLAMNASQLYFNPEDRKKFIDIINITGLASNHEVVLVSKTGSKKICTITASIQKVDQEGLVFYQGVVHDITERRKAEHDLKIAEKLVVTGRVARSLIHEIRNPLTNINLAVEQLEDEIKSDELKPNLEIIKRNSNRINVLVTEMMEKSKPAELKPAEIQIKIFLQKTLAFVKDRASLKNITIQTDFSDDNELIEGDESKLLIAFSNIIINAVESVEDNKGLIRLSSSCSDKKCHIKIEDNGCGISRENMDKIFEPYFTAKPNGMGLGLATTHNIIYSHKGTIEVDSTEGKGTIFSVHLNLL